MGEQFPDGPARSRAQAGMVAACLLLVGLLGACLWPCGDGPQTSQPYASATFGGPMEGWETGGGLSLSSGVLGVPIQEIEVGRRVLAELPEGVESERGDGDIYGEPDPAGWRRIKLRAEKVDGSFAEVELLRPISWVEEQDARVGTTVDISVPECGIDGNADVLAIEACPAILPGPGRVVTGTFAHQSATVVDVHVEGLEGPIGTTGNHPFWSEDRQEFVRADDLQPGERLRTVAGAPEVVAVVPRATSEPVYNLEVHYAHVYHVAADGVLVHNGKSRACKTLAKKIHGNARASRKPNHVYEIRNKRTGEVHKYGISGGKITKGGKSYRAQSQVRKLNKTAGADIYESRIISRNLTRDKALRVEQGRVNGYSAARQRAGLSSRPVAPPGNFRPLPEM